MAVSNELYGGLFEGLMKDAYGNLSSAGLAVSVALLTANAATAFDRSHTNFSSIVAHEVDDGVQTDYVRQTLATKTVTQTAGNTVITFDADNTSFGSEVTLTAQAAVVFEEVSGLLICFIDFGEELSSQDGTFAINWHTDGIFKVTIQTT